MSAFIVDPETINWIVNWLENEINVKKYASIIGKHLKEIGYDPEATDFSEKLATDMYFLNVEAVSQRYDDKTADDMKPEYSKFRPYEYRSAIQTFKSLKCWLYQCGEGNINETPLYKIFSTEIKLYLAEQIISKLPEYDKAIW